MDPAQLVPAAPSAHEPAKAMCCVVRFIAGPNHASYNGLLRSGCVRRLRGRGVKRDIAWHDTPSGPGLTWRKILRPLLLRGLLVWKS